MVTYQSPPFLFHTFFFRNGPVCLDRFSKRLFISGSVIYLFVDRRFLVHTRLCINHMVMPHRVDVVMSYWVHTSKFNKVLAGKTACVVQTGSIFYDFIKLFLFVFVVRVKVRPHLVNVPMSVTRHWWPSARNWPNRIGEARQPPWAFLMATFPVRQTPPVIFVVVVVVVIVLRSWENQRIFAANVAKAITAAIAAVTVHSSIHSWEKLRSHKTRGSH